MRDKANFYKLSKEEQEQLKEDGEICIDDNGNITSEGQRLKKYAEDLLPCAYGYLKNIEKDIRGKELPYVMSIEGDFGSGKTHFATRLCQYLRDYSIDTIYLNALEYDNIDPKLAILDVVSKNCKENNKPNQFSKLWQTFKSSTTVNGPLGICSTDLSKLHLKDEMQKIKEALQKSVKKNGRVVLITDELDRCDPRFCVNLLETIKHFFDLDGLFTILSFSDKALLATLSNTYGSDFIKNNSENYLTKFIDHRTKIYGIDNSSYSCMVSEFFQNNNCDISKEDLEEISVMFSGKKLSSRKTKICTERIISLINGIHDEKDLKLYSYIACRYDNDFEKITEMNCIDDDGSEANQLFSQRESRLERLKDGNNLEIAREFYITKYVYRGFYKNLRDGIRKCYQIICKDLGNAKKLTEIFLSDLFEKIDNISGHIR